MHLTFGFERSSSGNYFNQRQVLTALRCFLMIIQLIARKTFKVTDFFCPIKFQSSFLFKNNASHYREGLWEVLSGVKAYKWLGVLDSVSRGPSSDCVEVIRTIYTKDETNSYLRRAIS